jgi:hypothetical protein
MPTTVTIGMLVLGGILLLIALVGGNFKIFGAEISEKISNKGLRWTAGILGLGLLSGPLQGLKQTDLPSGNAAATHLVASRDFLVGRWRVDQSVGNMSGGSALDYRGDGSWNGTMTSFVGGIGTKVNVSGRWNVDELSDKSFRLNMWFAPNQMNMTTWQGRFRILDQDKIQNIEQNYVAERER